MQKNTWTDSSVALSHQSHIQFIEFKANIIFFIKKKEENFIRVKMDLRQGCNVQMSKHNLNEAQFSKFENYKVIPSTDFVITLVISLKTIENQDSRIEEKLRNILFSHFQTSCWTTWLRLSSSSLISVIASTRCSSVGIVINTPASMKRKGCQSSARWLKSVVRHQTAKWKEKVRRIQVNVIM